MTKKRKNDGLQLEDPWLKLMWWAVAFIAISALALIVYTSLPGYDAEKNDSDPVVVGLVVVIAIAAVVFVSPVIIPLFKRLIT